MDVTYLGNACFCVSSASATVLLDPFIEENPECPYSVEEVVSEFGPFDCVAVTHISFDHVGDAVTLATEYEIPVLTEPATAAYLRSEEVPDDRIQRVVWGLEAAVKDMQIRALEVSHVSSTTVEGSTVTGLPLAFLLSENGTSVHHLGDTSIFSDLQLFGNLYEPDAAMIGVGQAFIEESHPTGMPRKTREMTPKEAALAAKWLGSETVLPMHYTDGEVDEFFDEMDSHDISDRVVPLDPGESIEIS